MPSSSSSSAPAEDVATEDVAAEEAAADEVAAEEGPGVEEAVDLGTDLAFFFGLFAALP